MTERFYGDVYIEGASRVYDLCEDCGAIVVGTERHNAFHDAIEGRQALNINPNELAGIVSLVNRRNERRSYDD